MFPSVHRTGHIFWHALDALGMEALKRYWWVIITDVRYADALPLVASGDGSLYFTCVCLCGP